VNNAKENGPVNPLSLAKLQTARSESLSERVRSLRLKEQPRSSGGGSSWLPWLLCLILAGTTAYLGYSNYFGPQADRSGPNEELTTSDSPGAGSGARTARAVASSGEVVLDRKGYIIPAHQILLSPKVSGVIEHMDINDDPKQPLIEGVHVKKGDILARLETTDYQADYDRARAALNLSWQQFLELYNGNREEDIKAARADLEEMEANLKQLNLDYRRNVRLQNGALAQRDFEQTEYQYRAMDRKVEKMRQNYQMMLIGPRIERIEAAWAAVLQSEADLGKARWRLDNCTVRAPISGTILTKKAELGNLVNPVAFAGSLNICEMADLSDIEVDMSIEEREISKIFPGQQCKVRPEAFPEKLYEGVVSRLMPSADRAKSAIPVRVKLTVPKNEEGVYLKPDMGVNVSFLKKTEKAEANNKK
jgi:multidrug resistance efflux pump